MGSSDIESFQTDAGSCDVGQDFYQGSGKTKDLTPLFQKDDEPLSRHGSLLDDCLLSLGSPFLNFPSSQNMERNDSYRSPNHALIGQVHVSPLFDYTSFDPSRAWEFVFPSIDADSQNLCQIDRHTHDSESDMIVEALLDLNTTSELFTKKPYSYATYSSKKSGVPTSCKCKSSKCLKLYCKCFSSGHYCNPLQCRCTDCLNVPALAPRLMHPDNCRCSACNSQKSMIKTQVSDATRPSERHCKCKNSACLRLYCPCFQAGSLCNSLCRCVDCANTERENVAGGARMNAIERCLKRRRDAFDTRPKKRNNIGCACRNTL